MSQLLRGILGLVTSRDIILTVGLFVVTFAVSLGVISFILVKLPSTYFQESHSRTFLADHRSAVRWAGIIGKNALGVVLVLLGILMSVPGIPGQGVLTILLGIMLVDLPGKRRLESRILKQPKVLEKINGLRHKFSKPPLVLD